MKWILAFVLLSSLLASGCTQSGMLAGPGDSCRLVNDTYLEIAELDARVLAVEREVLWSRDLGYYAEGLVRLKNTDNESGWFIVTFNWMRPGQGMPYTEKKGLHLNPGDAGEFKFLCPNIDPQMGISFTYKYDSYPDSGRTVERQMEKEVCGQGF